MKFPGLLTVLLLLAAVCPAQTPDGLEFVNCTYGSPFGQIGSSWERESPGNYRYKMEIPIGSTAHVSLPVTTAQKIEIESKSKDFNPEKIENLQSGHFELAEGEYIIRVKLKN